MWPKPQAKADDEKKKKKKITDKLPACRKCRKDKKNCSLSGKSRAEVLKVLSLESKKKEEVRLPVKGRIKFRKIDDGTGTWWGSCAEPVLHCLLDQKDKDRKDIIDVVDSPRTSDEIERLTDELKKAQLEMSATVGRLVELVGRRREKGKERSVKVENDGEVMDVDDEEESESEEDEDDEFVVSGLPRADVNEEKGEGPSNKRRRV